jgi:hypothetical protein
MIAQTSLSASLFDYVNCTILKNNINSSNTILVKTQSNDAQIESMEIGSPKLVTITKWMK